MSTEKHPFGADQFTPTQFDSAEEKAKWANAMASWIQRGFPQKGWRKGLYHHLHTHLYGHIAHYNEYGFYEEWFADIHRQLQWLQYAASGGAFGGGMGDPHYTWSDVEVAFSAWIRESGLIVRYELLCSQAIEEQERLQLALLQHKYPKDQPIRCDSSTQSLAPVEGGDTLAHINGTPQPSRASFSSRKKAGRKKGGTYEQYALFPVPDR